MIPTSGGAAQTVVINVQVNTLGATQQLNRLTSEFRRFRDGVIQRNIDQSAGPLGYIRLMTNTTIRGVRELARLRTAFFLFYTVLLVRPAVNFIKSLADSSQTLAATFDNLENRFDNIKRDIGDAIAPAMEKLFKVFMQTLPDITEVLLAATDVVVKLLPGIAVFITSLSEAIKAMRLTFEFIVANLNKLRGYLPVLGPGGIILDWLLPKATSDAIRSELESRLADYKSRFEEVSKRLTDLGVSFAEESKGYGLGNLMKETGKNFQDALDTYFSESLEERNLAERYVKLRRGINTLQESLGKLVKDEFEDWKIPDVEMPDLSKIVAAAMSTGDLEKAIKDLSDKIKEIVKKAVEKSKNNVEDAADDLAKSFWDKFKKGLIPEKGEVLEKQIKTITEKLGKALRDGLESGVSDTFVAIMEQRFNKIRDAMIDLFNSVKRAAADFAASMIVRSAIEGVMAGVSGMGTWLFPKTFPAVKKAGKQEGGIVSTPGFYPLSEQGHAEGVVPLSRGRYIPVELKNKPGNIVNLTLAPQVIDAPSFEAWLHKSRHRIWSIISEGASGGSSHVRSAFKLNRT